MGLGGTDGSELRFAGYVEGLASVIGHADRVGPLRDYCVGLMLPCERKSVEPMAAVTAPERAAAQHQSLLHFVGNAAWSDERVLAKVGEMVLPQVERHGPIEAWIIDDTGFPKQGRHLRGGGTAILWPAWQTRQLSGRGVAIGCQSPCQPAGGLSAIFAARLPPKLIRRDPRHGPNSVKALALALPANAWRTIKWHEGSADWLSSRFARLRVRVAHRDYNLTESRPEEWLLVEWPEEEKEPTKYWLSTLPEGIAFRRLVDLAKLRWRIERDYQELKQEVGLGHFEGRGWRGFHHHATLCIAAYGFLIAERETIPPSGPRSTTLFPELAVPDGYRPRGSAATARASHPKLDRNHASTIDRRARQKPATMSVLQLCDRKALTAQKFMTQ